MDKYLYNYMCLNKLTALSKQSRKKIMNYFRAYHLINWHHVDNNRSYYDISPEVELPTGVLKNQFIESVKEHLENLNRLDTNYLVPSNIYFPKRFNMFEPLTDIIYYKGNKSLFNAPYHVAVVGTRKPTSYGKRVAYELGEFLGAAGVNVISGMALGIDGIVHEGVLKSGGNATAVLASGVNQPYPSSHRALYHKILKQDGLILSEMGASEMPMKYHFPMRNRLICGLADVVVIIEASHKSGSLITARYAAEYGKEIFALPGNIYHNTSKGSNQLIFDGATPLIRFEDILTMLNFDKVSQPKKSEQSDISENSKLILEELKKFKRLTVEQIQEKTKLDTGRMQSAIMELVLDEYCEYVSINEIEIR